MDSPSGNTCRLRSLLRSLGRAVTQNECNVHDCVQLRRGFSQLSFVYLLFPSIYFLSFISESFYHFNLPVNVRGYVSAGIVFRLKFASRTGHFRVESAGGTSGLNTGWREFSPFQIDCHARLTFLLSWVSSKAKRGKHVNSLKLIRFKSSLSWCVSSFGTFTSAFILFSVFTLKIVCWRMSIRWRVYTCRMYAFYAEHVRK